MTIGRGLTTTSSSMITIEMTYYRSHGGSSREFGSADPHSDAFGENAMYDNGQEDLYGVDLKETNVDMTSRQSQLSQWTDGHNKPTILRGKKPHATGAQMTALPASYYCGYERVSRDDHNNFHDRKGFDNDQGGLVNTMGSCPQGAPAAEQAPAASGQLSFERRRRQVSIELLHIATVKRDIRQRMEQEERYILRRYTPEAGLQAAPAQHPTTAENVPLARLISSEQPQELSETEQSLDSGSEFNGEKWISAGLLDD